MVVTNRIPIQTRQRAFTLTELLAALAIIGVIAFLIIPRISGHSTAGDAAACHASQGEIEIQAQLWFRENGSYPAANLSDIGIDPNFFPDGLPTCPADGSSFTIDTATGRVIGHNH